MNIKAFITVGAAFLLFSCKDVSVKQIIFDGEQRLTAEKIRVSEIFSPDFITLKKDLLVIASSLSDTMLFAYSLPSLVYRQGFGTKGQGPNDIQYFPMFCESPESECLYIWGYTPLAIKKNAD